MEEIDQVRIELSNLLTNIKGKFWSNVEIPQGHQSKADELMAKYNELLKQKDNG